MIFPLTFLPPSLPIAIGTSPRGEGALNQAFPPWGKRERGSELNKKAVKLYE